MIVVDATTIVSGLLMRGDARDFLANNELHIPTLADSEIVSTLTRMVRNKDLAATAAKSTLDAWLGIAVQRHMAYSDLLRMWDLRHNVKAYDATYVALAERLQIPLVTCDKRLTTAAGVKCELVLVTG
jgi:predicted nucleic acid-binding protein